MILIPSELAYVGIFLFMVISFVLGMKEGIEYERKRRGSN